MIHFIEKWRREKKKKRTKEQKKQIKEIKYIKSKNTPTGIIGNIQLQDYAHPYFAAAPAVPHDVYRYSQALHRRY